MIKLLNIPIIIAGTSEKARKEKLVEIREGFTTGPYRATILSFEKETIGIDIIKEISLFISRKLGKKERRIVVIAEPKKFTIEAQNAFLKTLEERSEKALIIFTVNNQNSLLETILSRSQIVNLSGEKEIASSLLKNFDDFGKILSLPIQEGLLKMTGAFANNEEVLNWLESLILVGHQKMIEESDLSDVNKLDQIKKFLRILEESRKMLFLNINHQSCLDWIMLKFSETNVLRNK